MDYKFYGHLEITSGSDYEKYENDTISDFITFKANTLEDMKKQITEAFDVYIEMYYKERTN